MQFTDLFRLAQAALEASSEGDEALLAFEKYAAAFDELSSRLETELSKEELMNLTALHQNVVTRAEQLTKEARIDLEGLRKRGKGILTYAESLRPEGGTGPRRKG